MEDKLESAKNKLLKYKDLFGGEIIYKDEIRNAKNMEDLYQIVKMYRDHQIECAHDANRHLDHFWKEKINNGR
jgi:hypothetical protein